MRHQDHPPAADGVHFVVGRDLEAHWIVIETHGLCGGLFRDEAAALRFAEEECEAYRADLEISREPISLNSDSYGVLDFLRRSATKAALAEIGMANEKMRKLRSAGMTVRGGAFVLRGHDARRLDWRDPYHLALAMSWPRFAALFLGVDLSLNFFFALLYLARPGSLVNARPGSLTDAFFFSVETLATVGYGVMAPATLYGHIVATVEIFAGMTFMTIMTGLVFVRFSRPRARIIYAENAVIGQFNGERALMIRIGNGRAHAMAETNAELSALISEWTTEGQFFRRIYDLPLMRAHIPIFGLTWTLIHRIDESSPLYKYTAESFPKFVTRLFLSIESRDPMLSAHVYDNKDYDPGEVLFGHRYADAVAVDEQGRTIADMSRVGWTEPDGLEAAAN